MSGLNSGILLYFKCALIYFRPETLKAAIDVIGMCCVTPKSQLQLLATVPLADEVTTASSR